MNLWGHITVQIPTSKVLIISGLNKSSGVHSKAVYQYHISTKELEILPDIKHARSMFAVQYTYGDKILYVIGGADNNNQCISDCEKYDIT